MSFIKTADSEVLEVIKIKDGKEEKKIKCPKCGKFHLENEPCEEKNECTGNDK